MSNPAKSASEIDWDKIAKRLGRAFDKAMNSVENGDYFEDQDSCAALIAASTAAKALATVAARAQAEKEGGDKSGFKISKPAAS